MKAPLYVLVLALTSAPVWADPSASQSQAEVMIEQLGLRQSSVPVSESPGWKRPSRVLVRESRPERLEALRAVAPDVEIVPVGSAGEAADLAGGAQAIIGICDQQILEREPGLHWIQVYSAGVDRCVTLPAMQQGQRLLTNAQRIASPALAETAIAMTMALVRGLDVYHANQLRSDWRRDVGLDRERLMELDGRTMLVVGLGGIGSQTARRADALGMRVVATRNSRREGPAYVEYVGLADETLELARRADVVVNTVPLTDQTRGVFDADFFAAMKPSAFFISVGRGASTVTDDLVAALRNGDIAGAGLDVVDPEPLPADHPLWTMPRVILTPHTGGRSDRSSERLFLLVQENLRRYVAGEPMLSVVDIERGY